MSLVEWDSLARMMIDDVNKSVMHEIQNRLERETTTLYTDVYLQDPTGNSLIFIDWWTG